MTAVKHPLIDLVYNDETGRYIGHLERKILRFTLEDMKMRALLELLTGDMWDDQDFREMTDADIQQCAIDTLKRRLQMTDGDAKALVTQRWQAANPPKDVEQLHATYLVGAKPKVPPHNITISRPLAMSGMALNYDHKKHLQGLEQAAQNREARRNQV